VWRSAAPGLVVLWAPCDAAAKMRWLWVTAVAALSAHAEPLGIRFLPPPGFTRVQLAEGGFGAWLRELPLLPEGTPVKLHTGGLKANQTAHAAVVDLDVGTADLQQCADAVMRLRAEWQWSRGGASDVSFNDTAQGKPMRFAAWAAGARPRAEGRRLVWAQSAKPDASRSSFRRYLDTVFVWAGTASLAKQLVARRSADVAPGDVLIQPGFPGHAVLVLDVAIAPSGEKRVLLGQSYMPAQQFHVLRANAQTAWFEAPTDETSTQTPEWEFAPGALRTW
jgi:hypothetical protein